MTTLEVGQTVVINIPGNTWVHDMHARIKEIRPCMDGAGHYYLVMAKDLPTGEFRALPHEVCVLRDGGILDTNTTETVHGAARMAGFTGDICKKCEGARMVRNGACLLCQDCGESSGCS